jgi:copper chaperone CopZ
MKIKLYVFLVVLVVAGGVVAFNTFAARSSENYQVEMSVSRLTCGSCVETIREAVTSLDGSSKVETDVALARSIVEFDPEQIDADRIAETITNAGYPATILFVKNSQGETLSEIDTDMYVAKVGTRMIKRDDFNRAFEQRMQAAELANQPVSINSAFQEAWMSLLRQELLLNAAENFEISISDAELDKQVAELDKANGVDREALRKSLMIDGYLALQYPDRKPNGIEMANLLNALNSKTPADIFDKNLKRYLAAGKGGSGGGCGGGCCG